MIKINTDEIDRFAVELIELSEKSRDNVQKAIKKSAFNIESQAKKNLASNKSVVTGHLRRSISHKVSMTEGIVSANTKYAEGVEKGTKPHIIRAKKKKALYWQGANHPVKVVNHPGSRAKPYLIPALKSEQPKFIQNLKEAVKID